VIISQLNINIRYNSQAVNGQPGNNAAFLWGRELVFTGSKLIVC